MSGCHPSDQPPMSIDMEHNEKTKHWLMVQMEEMNARVFELAKQIEFLREQRRPEELSMMLEKIKSFYADYGHRLAIIEDLFAGKSFKPIHDAMEVHVEAFNKRIEALEDWRKKLHNDLICPSGGYMWQTQPSNYDTVLAKKFNDLQAVVNSRLENLEGYMRMEDRVTASDILLRLSHLESQFDEICKNYDANRVIVQRQPYKCPICEGAGYSKPEIRATMQSMTIDGVQCKKGDSVYFKATCRTCEGKGIVWG